MANAYKKQIRRARNAIADFQSAENADIKGDFTAGQSQLDAITANLRTAGAGIGANLTKSQMQTLRAVTRHTGQGLREGRTSLRKTGQQMTRDYGSAIGGATGESALATSRALLKGTGDTRRATLGAVGLLQRGGQTALQLQKTGAKEAAAGAEYAMAVALKSRNLAAATTVAEMQFDLETLKLQHEQAMELAKANFERERRALQDEQDEAVSEGRPSNAQLYALAPKVAANMATQPWIPVEDENGNITGYTKPTATQRAQAYGLQSGLLVQTSDGVVPADENAANQMKYVLEVANNMDSGMGAGEAAQTAAATLYGDRRGFNIERANEAISSGVKAERTSFASRVLQQMFDEPDGSKVPWQDVQKMRWILHSRGDDDLVALLDELMNMPGGGRHLLGTAAVRISQASDSDEWDLEGGY